MLIDKAKQNKDAVAWAESKEYYHIATSRNYYCIYQKMILLGNTKGFTKEYTPDSTSKKDFGSHERLYYFLIERGGLNLKQRFVMISDFLRAKSYREKADYRNEMIEEIYYNSTIKTSFANLDEVLSELISEKGA